MTRNERLDAIVTILEQNGEAHINDLADHFKVTDMTIRRDFDALVQDGKIVRTHGGAILRESNSTPSSVMPEASYMSRNAIHDPSKTAIAKAAARLIQPGNYVYLDSGSTTNHLTKCIGKDFPCTFITNGINIAADFLSRSFSNVIVVGGELDINTWSTRGTMTEQFIDNFHADIAFLGCNSVSSDGNVMIGNLSELGIKHKIMSVSNKIYLLADSSKFDQYSLVAYASVRHFAGIITDRDIPINTATEIKRMGGNIIIAD